MNTKTENKICEHCNKNFEISSGDLSLYEKAGVELPVLCFYCRTRQNFAFWPFGKFRKGISDLSGESFITILPKDSKYPIYSKTEWYGDKWEPLDYGVGYDENKSFLEQFNLLRNRVPHPHQHGVNNINCDYCEDVWDSKNCYLSRSAVNAEDLFYSYRNLGVKNSIDVAVCFDSDRCFDSFECHNAYKLFYSRYSRDCLDSYFLYDCRNCSNCFMSWNLRNKSYCIENVQYSKEEYEDKIKSFNLGSYESIQILKKHFDEIIKDKVVHRENSNLKIHNSTGNFLVNTKDCFNCNTVLDSENCGNFIRGGWMKSCIDVVGCFRSELLGSCCGCNESYNLKYSLWSSARYSEYLEACVDCEYCFGCVGLKKKKYCILNKQYTKEEYSVLKEKIINDMKKVGEYGKMPSYDAAPTAFNFSTGMIYFPETQKEEILALGGYWEELDESKIDGMDTSLLPDHINDVKDEIISEALICPKTGWRFNIAKNELSFYKANNIPLPRYHFDVRTKEQLQYLAVLKAHPYKCCYCHKDINAYYLPEWGYKKIACEECYKQNIA